MLICTKNLHFSDFVRANSEKNQNGYLLNVLICPAYLTETFKVGEQLIELDLKMNPFNAKDIKKIEAGLLERSHFLQEDPKLGIPSLVIDFKHYFTIDTKRLYSHDSSNVYLASLTTPYRERLSQRFCNYLSRIGLPDKCTVGKSMPA